MDLLDCPVSLGFSGLKEKIPKLVSQAGRASVWLVLFSGGLTKQKANRFEKFPLIVVIFINDSGVMFASCLFH